MSTCSLSLVKHGHAKYAFSNNKYLQFNIQFNLIISKFTGPLQYFKLSEIWHKGSERLSKIGNFIYLLTASHNIHRLAWGPYARGALGQLPIVPMR